MPRNNANKKNKSQIVRKVLEDVSLKLMQHIPEFEQVFRENVKFDDGKILAYSIFGDLGRFFVDRLGKEDLELTNRIQNFIEGMLNSSNPRIQELAAFGFLENLDSTVKNNEAYEKLKQKLKPRLLKELNEIDSWWYEGNIDAEIWKKRTNQLKKSYTNLMAGISKIFKDVDPYNLIQLGAPEDEYAAEIGHVVIASKNVKSESELEEKIKEILEYSFLEKVDTEKLKILAKKIFCKLPEDQST